MQFSAKYITLAVVAAFCTQDETFFATASEDPTSEDMSEECIALINAKRRDELSPPLASISVGTALSTAVVAALTASMANECALPTFNSEVLDGQLLFSMPGEVTCEDAVNSWYGQISEYGCTYPANGFSVEAVTKEFAQMMYWNADSAGCARTVDCDSNHILCYISPNVGTDISAPFSDSHWDQITKREDICSGVWFNAAGLFIAIASALSLTMAY